jgi:antitoxin component YwqK of YwqJK toxin-antitoxin module
MGKSVVYVMCLFALVGCAKGKYDAVKTAYFHKYGVEVADETDFLTRGGNGEVVMTLKDGVVVHKNYSEGRLHGLSSWTFPHSDLFAKTALFANGVKTEETLYFTNGVPRQKSDFRDNGEILITSWYEDATPRAIEQFRETLLINGQYFTPGYESESLVQNSSGTRTLRNEFGELVARETLEAGKVTLSKTFHPNGTPSAEIPYADGKISGIKKTFTPQGAPLTVEEWVAGEIHGFVYQYQNGQRIAKIPYVHGLRNGIEQRFKLGTDTVVEEISWIKDVRDGPSTSIVEGTRITDWYFNDEKVSKSEYVERSAMPHG